MEKIVMAQHAGVGHCHRGKL